MLCQVVCTQQAKFTAYDCMNFQPAEQLPQNKHGANTIVLQCEFGFMYGLQSDVQIGLFPD